jgi:hypothetical protein
VGDLILFDLGHLRVSARVSGQVRLDGDCDNSRLSCRLVLKDRIPTWCCYQVCLLQGRIFSSKEKLTKPNRASCWDYFTLEVIFVSSMLDLLTPYSWAKQNNSHLCGLEREWARNPVLRNMRMCRWLRQICHRSQRGDC